MVKTLAAVLSAVCLCNAQSYRLVSLTDGSILRFANAGALNDSGSVIGDINSNGQPVVFTAQGTLRPPMLSITGINAAGTIVGSCEDQPCFSVPPYTDTVNLSSVFGWIFGQAVAINDFGDIVAEGSYPTIDGSGYAPPYTFDNWFPGLNITEVFFINNRRQVVGYAQDLKQYLLYTPGTGVTVLPQPPEAINNNGDILLGLMGAQYIQTSSGQRYSLPGTYSWFSINDRDEAVGSAYAGQDLLNLPKYTVAYFSPETGAVDITNSIDNPQGYIEIVPSSINNSGEIAVSYRRPMPNVVPSAGVGLLVPTTGAAGTAQTFGSQTPMRRRATGRVTGAQTLNGRALTGTTR